MWRNRRVFKGLDPYRTGKCGPETREFPILAANPPAVSGGGFFDHSFADDANALVIVPLEEIIHRELVYVPMFTDDPDLLRESMARGSSPHKSANGEDSGEEDDKDNPKTGA